MDLIVEDGGRLELSAANPGGYAEALARIRPNTPDALRRLVGLSGRGQRLDLDSDEFTELPARERSVPLLLDRPVVERMDTGLLRAMLTTITDTERMPESVVLRQRYRERDCGCGGSGSGGEAIRSAGADTSGGFISSVTYLVPEWLRGLKVHVPVFRLGDIVVGLDAQLILAAPSPTHLVANNFYIRAGGSVRQTVDHVMVHLSGELKGEA